MKAASKLEVLDTAGAEQFNSLNEVYLKVIVPSHCRAKLTVRQSGRGFVLVFRYCAHGSNIRLHFLREPSLTQEATLHEVDNLRRQILRVKGGDAVRQLSLRKLHRTLIFKRRKCRWSLLAQNWILSMKGRFLGRRSNHCQVGGAFRSTRHRQREIGTLQKFLKAYYDKCGSIIKQMGQGGEGVDEVVALLCEYLHRFPLYSMTYYDCDEFCMTYGLRCTRTLTILLTLRDCNVHRFYLTLFVCKVKNVRNDKHCQHILFFHPYSSIPLSQYGS